MEKLALTYEGLGDLPKAKELWTKVYMGYKRIYGPTNSKTKYAAGVIKDINKT